MFKNILLLSISAVLFCQLAIGQSIQPSVLGTSGAHFTNSNAQLSWTAGEVITSTESNGNLQVTQGFHQVDLLITTIEDSFLDRLQIQISPNPTGDKLTVEIMDNDGALRLQLYDITGKLLEHAGIPAGKYSSEINLKMLPAGTYILNISTGDEYHFRSFLIEKNG